MQFSAATHGAVQAIGARLLAYVRGPFRQHGWRRMVVSYYPSFWKRARQGGGA